MWPWVPKPKKFVINIFCVYAGLFYAALQQEIMRATSSVAANWLNTQSAAILREYEALQNRAVQLVFEAEANRTIRMTTDVSNKHIPAAIDRLMPRSPYNSSSSAIAAKVIEDIHFLQDRIERIKKLQTPNSTVLKTYQSMLESREAVLAWLRENGDLEEEQEETGDLSHRVG